MSPRSFPGPGIPLAFLLASWLGPGAAMAAQAHVNDPRPSLGTAARRVLARFAAVDPQSWDDDLQRLRPAPASAERKVRSLALVRPEDVVEPAAGQRAKLDALQPILAYLVPGSGIEAKVLRLDVAWAGYLDGAAVLLSSGALDRLTAAELQAVVAHELAHGFFAREYEAARARGDYETVREIELRCDAVAILTLRRLGLEPQALLSGVAKLIAANERLGLRNSPDLTPAWSERREFGRAMAR